MFFRNNFSLSFLFLLFLNYCPSLSSNQDPAGELDYGSIVVMMARNLGKKFPDFIDRYNAVDLISRDCLISWRKFVTETGVSEDLEKLNEGDFTVESRRALLELISSEKCNLNEHGKFCKMNFIANYRLGSRLRNYNTSFGMCFPNQCSQTDLNNLLSRFSEGYKEFMDVDLTASNCGSVNHAELLNEELIEKHFSALNRTFNELTHVINADRIAVHNVTNLITEIVNSTIIESFDDHDNHTRIMEGCRCICKAH